MADPIPPRHPFATMVALLLVLPLIAARPGRSYIELGSWDRFVQSMDWTRIHIQACGQHMRDHDGDGDTTCGSCIKSILLRGEDDG